MHRKQQQQVSGDTALVSGKAGDYVRPVLTVESGAHIFRALNPDTTVLSFSWGPIPVTVHGGFRQTKNLENRDSHKPTLTSSFSEGETGGLSVKEPLRGPLL